VIRPLLHILKSTKRKEFIRDWREKKGVPPYVVWGSRVGAKTTLFETLTRELNSGSLGGSWKLLTKRRVS